MPLRDDLLEPIAGENPSGPDLRYDKLFDQIKEARVEEDESLPSGDWGRSVKKADRALVVKLAGETLAKRSKDLRLAGWYLESLVRKEGFGQLSFGLEFLSKLQAEFWDTLHPVLDEDGSADLRIGAIETAANLLASSAKAVPLARGGVALPQYLDAQAIGFETGEMSDGKREARQEAVRNGRMTGEELQKSVDGTSKSFYIEMEGHLTASLEAFDALDGFHQERYGDDYPSLGRLKSALEEIGKVVRGVLFEKRKTDPDPVAADAEPEAEAEQHDPFAQDPFIQYDQIEAVGVDEIVPVASAPSAASKRRSPVGLPTDEKSAYEQIAVAAEFLRTFNNASPVPYLVCSALRLGETRGTGVGDSGFLVAPPTETRQALRKLANEASWDELMMLCLRTMAEPCGRGWLDVQRYAWRAASESYNSALAMAVVATVRGLLVDMPELRGMMMDDDTPVANPETLAWIDSIVLPPVATPETTPFEEPEEPVFALPPAREPEPSAAPDIYETALQVLKRGRVSEAINMLVRDTELQPSGRMRFHRRVQMAQLCLLADKAAVAYPVLVDLSSEMERRSLESWESGEMLAHPLSLLLQCLDMRKGSLEEREAIFDRLCRLDPQAALASVR